MTKFEPFGTGIEKGMWVHTRVDQNVVTLYALSWSDSEAPTEIRFTGESHWRRVYRVRKGTYVHHKGKRVYIQLYNYEQARKLYEEGMKEE